MRDIPKLSGWEKGINNLSPVDQLPEGHARDLLNLDPVKGGALHARSAKIQSHPLASVRGGIACPDGFLLVADGWMKHFSCASGQARDLLAIPGATTLVGAEINGDIFLSAGNQLLRYRNGVVTAGGVDLIFPGLYLDPGRLPAGIYRVAVTVIDALGIEHGSQPLVVSVPEGSSFRIEWQAPAAAAKCRLYVSPCNSETLYLQDDVISPAVIDQIKDDTQRLEVVGLEAPPPPSQIYAYKGRLVYVAGSALWVSSAYAPHLVDRVAGFFAYASPISLVAPTDGGLFVVAGDETFFLRAPGTNETSNSKVLAIGAEPGSAVALRDGRAAWMTERGQAFGSPDGSVSLPQEHTYAPNLAASAAAGLIEGNGIELIATAPKGVITQNRLGVADAFDLEIDE